METIDLVQTLQQYNATIPEIKQAPLQIKDYPASLNTSGLPIALTLPLTGTIQRASYRGSYDDTQTFRVMVYVDPIAQGKPFEYAQSSVILMDAVKQFYATLQRIETSIWLVHPISYSGLTTLQYAGTEYHGFSLDININSFRS